MDPGAAMREHLEQLKALRGSQAVTPARLAELKAFQAARLAASYADIASQPRYRDATAFFLEDLYGPKDFSRRDASMLRVLPAMTRMMPASALETAMLAIELEALSEALDHRTAECLPPGPVDEESYAQAYRQGTTREERERQIDLLVTVGERLDRVVKVPLVHGTLKLMRAPARAAGLDELQHFLERGFSAFRAMRGAREFLDIIRTRETAILNRLFSGAPGPFSV
jgi:hypothetical protein